jgi:hypothetical protein
MMTKILRTRDGNDRVNAALDAAGIRSDVMPLAPRELAQHLTECVLNGKHREGYAIPTVIVHAVDYLLETRETCEHDEVEVVDAAILRLLEPWTRDGED